MALGARTKVAWETVLGPSANPSLGVLWALLLGFHLNNIVEEGGGDNSTVWTMTLTKAKP